MSSLSSSDQLLLAAMVLPLIGIIIWLLFFSGLFTLKHNPHWVREPKPRLKRLHFGHKFSSWGCWKSGIYGPKAVKDDAVPYIAHHALAVDNHTATIRANSWYYSRKVLLGLFIFGMAFVVGTGQTTKDYLNFSGRGGGGCPIIIQTDQGQVFKRESLDGSISSYFYREYCFIRNTLFYDTRYNTYEKKIALFWDDVYLSYYVTLFGFSGLLWLLLSKAPPPLVFDRRNRLVYTRYKGKLYLSSWDTLAFTFYGGARLSTLGVELYTLDRHGAWRPRWFSIANHLYWGELRSHYLDYYNIITGQRWHSMRAWLLRYMEKGPSAVHPVLPFTSFLDTISPRKATLPDDITEQVRALLADHKKGYQHNAPGDPDFSSKPCDSVKTILKRPHKVSLQELLGPNNWRKYQQANQPPAQEHEQGHQQEQQHKNRKGKRK